MFYETLKVTSKLSCSVRHKTPRHRLKRWKDIHSRIRADAWFVFFWPLCNLFLSAWSWNSWDKGGKIIWVGFKSWLNVSKHISKLPSHDCRDCNMIYFILPMPLLLGYAQDFSTRRQINTTYFPKPFFKSPSDLWKQFRKNQGSLSSLQWRYKITAKENWQKNWPLSPLAIEFPPSAITPRISQSLFWSRFSDNAGRKHQNVIIEIEPLLPGGDACGLTAFVLFQKPFYRITITKAFNKSESFTVILTQQGMHSSTSSQLKVKIWNENDIKNKKYLK